MTTCPYLLKVKVPHNTRLMDLLVYTTSGERIPIEAAYPTGRANAQDISSIIKTVNEHHQRLAGLDQRLDDACKSIGRVLMRLDDPHGLKMSPDPFPPKVKVGDRVIKPKGYRVTGTVLAIYTLPTIPEWPDTGERAVVNIEPQNFQHIYRLDQLEVIERDGQKICGHHQV